MDEQIDKEPHDLSLMRFWILLSIILSVTFFYVEWVSWTRYASHNLFIVDAGNFDAILSGPRHGRFLQSPYDWNVDANYFGGHFRPVLIYLMPLYFIFDHPMTLLTVQNLCYVFAAIPLVLLALSLLRNRILALSFVPLYLANHFVASVQFAVHPEIMSFVSFFAIFLAVERKQPVLLALALIWTLSIKEDFGIYIAAYGISLFLEKDRSKWKWGSWLIVAGIAGFLFASVVMHLSGKDAFVAGGNNPFSRFQDFGETKAEVIVGLLTHPLEVAKRILRLPLLWLFASVGFLSLLDYRAVWLVLLGASVFMITGDHLVGDLAYYYSYPAVPFLFYTALRGTRFILPYLKSSCFYHLMTGVLLVLAIIQVPMKTRTDGLRRVPFEISDHDRLFKTIVDEIPPDVSVAAQFDLFVHVPNRKIKLPLRSEYLDQVDYVVLDLQGNFGDISGPAHAEEVKEIGIILEKDFTLVVKTDGYILTKRNDVKPEQK